jgi:hypothetical protein
MKKQIKQALFIIIIFLLNVQKGWSQGNITLIDTLGSKKLTIRNSFESTDDKADPATVSFTLPSGKPQSFLIDAGVELDTSVSFNSNGHLTGYKYGIFAVINKNTLIEKQQNEYRAGGQFQWKWGTQNDDYNSIKYINATLQYAKNQTDTTHSIIATGYFSYLHNRSDTTRSFFVNSYHQIESSSIFYSVNFDVGLEFQDVFQAGSSPTGLQARFYGDGSVNIALRQPHSVTGKKGKKTKQNKYTWPKLFELTIDGTARYAYVSTVKGENRYLPLFKPSLSYYPLLNDSLSIGLSFNSGSDPVAGLQQQRFWQLAIQFQK